VFFNRRDEMIGMLFSNVLNAKIVHYKEEEDGSPFVPPETGCVTTLVVPIGRKSLMLKRVWLRVAEDSRRNV
jgi:hypothetical protein